MLNNSEQKWLRDIHANSKHVKVMSAKLDTIIKLLSKMCERLDDEEPTESEDREDRSCEFCRWELCDGDIYPCSRCIHNMPTDDKFKTKDNVCDEDEH